jgi:hypothetical protein
MGKEPAQMGKASTFASMRKKTWLGFFVFLIVLTVSRELYQLYRYTNSPTGEQLREVLENSRTRDTFKKSNIDSCMQSMKNEGSNLPESTMTEYCVCTTDEIFSSFTASDHAHMINAMKGAGVTDKNFDTSSSEQQEQIRKLMSEDTYKKANEAIDKCVAMILKKSGKLN